MIKNEEEKTLESNTVKITLFDCSGKFKQDVEFSWEYKVNPALSEEKVKQIIQKALAILLDIENGAAN